MTTRQGDRHSCLSLLQAQRVRHSDMLCTLAEADALKGVVGCQTLSCIHTAVVCQHGKLALWAAMILMR